jgi:hypothetical protein
MSAVKGREAVRKARLTQASGAPRPGMDKWKGRPQLSPKTSRHIDAVLGQNDAQLTWEAVVYANDDREETG